MPTLSLNRPALTEMIGRMAHAMRQESAPRAGVEPAPESSPDLRTLARIIDHTMLRPQATSDELDRFFCEAVSLGVGAISIHQTWVPRAVKILRGTGIKVGSVVGFPFGATHPSVKRAEAEASIRAGAEELDMVMSVGALRSGNLDGVLSDIRGVADIAHDACCILKVILENAYLSDEQKVTACRLAKQAGADYVKTSTGLGPSGATADDVRLMRNSVGPQMGVKAAGGIRSLGDAVRMLQAGADRLGTSASAAILAEAASRVG
ncbi:MAG TPA: deoxyribose-phosphate aldolase [Terriglobia bacterium]|nr:deoxyribose-phosphate aldolase [Terriglobia bacterium]